MNIVKKTVLAFIAIVGTAFAEAPAGAVAGTGTAAAPKGLFGSMGSMPIMLILIFVVWYFLLIMPQQKKEKKRKEMLNQVKRGDKVVTIGGIYGIVENIKDDVVTLKLGSNNVEFIRSAISRVVTHDEKPGTPA